MKLKIIYKNKFKRIVVRKYPYIKGYFIDLDFKDENEEWVVEANLAVFSYEELNRIYEFAKSIEKEKKY